MMPASGIARLSHGRNGWPFISSFVSPGNLSAEPSMSSKILRYFGILKASSTPGADATKTKMRKPIDVARARRSISGDGGGAGSMVGSKLRAKPGKSIAGRGFDGAEFHLEGGELFPEGGEFGIVDEAGGGWLGCLWREEGEGGDVDGLPEGEEGIDGEDRAVGFFPQVNSGAGEVGLRLGPDERLAGFDGRFPEEGDRLGSPQDFRETCLDLGYRFIRRRLLDCGGPPSLWGAGWSGRGTTVLRPLPKRECFPQSESLRRI